MPPSDDASGDLAVTGSVSVPASALSWRFSRSSGPGGQGVNTADSRGELSVSPLEIPGLHRPPAPPPPGGPPRGGAPPPAPPPPPPPPGAGAARTRPAGRRNAGSR